MSEFIHQKVQFLLVWQKEDAKSASIEFWNRTFPKVDFDVEERSSEVVYHIVYENIVIGLSTAKAVTVRKFNNNDFYNFRLLIHPEYRVPGLSDKLIIMTLSFLESQYQSGVSKCIGILTLLENQNLINSRRQAVLPTSGLILAGYTKQGKQIRVKYFKGVTI